MILTAFRCTLVVRLLLVAVLAFLSSDAGHAFAPQYATSKSRMKTTAVHAGLFGQDSVLGGLFGGKDGPKTIVDLPAKDIKIGALRFFLQVFLVGEQNKPEPKSWSTKQGDEAGELQVYYQDGTGMLSIRLQEYTISIVRHGERPSLQYQLQESVLLHSVLDELSSVAFGVAEDNIELEKRLLVLQDDASIERARKKLPARKAL